MLELILGVIGAITGVISIVLHLKRFLKEKPLLTVDVEKFTHLTSNDNTKMNIKFLVHNTGDKGTTLNKLEWWIRSFKPSFHEVNINNGLEIHLKAHESKRLGCEFDLGFKIDELLNTVKFKLHHTHGVTSFQGTSLLIPSKGTIPLNHKKLMDALAIDEKRWTR